MSDYLFDTPFWLPLIIAAVGVFLFITGNRRQEAKVRTTGVGVVALAALLAVVSYVVDTDREKMEKRSRELVASFVARDWARFESLVDPKASLLVGGGTVFADRRQIVDAARAAQDRDAFQSITVRSVDADEPDRGYVTTRLELLSFQEATQGRPFNSTWEFEWAKGPDNAWALTQVRAIKLGNVEGDSMRLLMPRVSR
jgi:hypothetical protein